MRCIKEIAPKPLTVRTCSGRCCFVQSDTTEVNGLVANLFAQDGFGLDKRYADYDAQRKALTTVRTVATPLPSRTLTAVRIPCKMGSGLAGGSWSVVEQIIKDELVAYDIPVEIWNKESF